MSEATTGVAHANARVSTIPKLSPPSDGATSTLAAVSSSVNASCSRKPSTSIPSSGTRSRVSRSRTASGSAPTMRNLAPVRRRISGHARSITCRPLRGSCRPAKRMRCSRPPGSASGGTRTPFGTISYSPPSQRCADSAAWDETAIRWSIRSARKPQTGVAIRIQASSPDAWKVPTIGHRAIASTAMQIAGVIGSWRCSTSKRSRSRIRLTRSTDDGLRTMFGSEPLAGTITERPTGSTSGGGRPWRPWRGWRTLVKVPGGSWPMIDRVSIPSRPSASAWSSACSRTAPQNDQE